MKKLIKMNQKTRVFLTMIAVLGLIIGLYFFTDWFSKTTGYILGEDQKIKFAQCIIQSKSALYLTTNCKDCDKQREILGENVYNLLKKIICDPDSLCGGLKKVPAWEIEGKIYYGIKTYKELDKISSCDIDK